MVAEITRGNATVLAQAATLADPAICAVTWGELFSGVARARDPRGEARKLRNAFRGARHYNIDRLTARRYAAIRAALAAAGTPIPQNDIWIAAVAVQHGLTLVTHDAHFRRVRGLTVQVWPK